MCPVRDLFHGQFAWLRSKRFLMNFSRFHVDFGSHAKEEIITALETLCDPDAWDFLRQSEAKPTCKVC